MDKDKQAKLKLNRNYLDSFKLIQKAFPKDEEWADRSKLYSTAIRIDNKDRKELLSK